MDVDEPGLQFSIAHVLEFAHEYIGLLHYADGNQAYKRTSSWMLWIKRPPRNSIYHSP